MQEERRREITEHVLYAGYCSKYVKKTESYAITIFVEKSGIM